MTTCGIYILWDNQDVSKFYLLLQKWGANAPFAPPGYATVVGKGTGKTPLKSKDIDSSTIIDVVA